MNLGILVILVILGGVLGYFLRILIVSRKKTPLEKEITDQISSAKVKANEIVLDANDKASSILLETQKEERERKQELRRLEERLHNKEDELSRERVRQDQLEKEIKEKLRNLGLKEEEWRSLTEKASKELEKISGMSEEDVKKMLIEDTERKYREELSEHIAKMEKDRKEEIEKKSVEIITSAIQRYARESVPDLTTTQFPLPNEDIKGKIIGREGRNIRTFERLTGVEVVIDETPESLVLSSFDPFRRELAKLALEKLIKDGRIQPVRIEEKVEEARTELDDRIRKTGEEAAQEVGIFNLPKEINYLLGKLNYRTSYGQNVLSHSLEVTHIAGMIASELGLNVGVAKKGALLHDIGKAIDHDVEGTHVELGRKILKKHGIEDEVIKAMEAHHEEYPYSTSESYIVSAADAISAARPGARRDTLEKYLKRLEEIENIVNSFDGVKNSYAVSAGREVRVFAVPEKIDDFGAFRLAKDISEKIHSDLKYPGEIKVTVIREVKAVEYAR